MKTLDIEIIKAFFFVIIELRAVQNCPVLIKRLIIGINWTTKKANISILSLL